MVLLIAGASGMVGSKVLEFCLEDEEITEIRSVLRKPSNIEHPKLKERVQHSFEGYPSGDKIFENVDAAFFCIGAYTGQVPDAEFRKITVDYAVSFAQALEKGSPGARMILLSGAGADRSEKSRTSFARYKGMAENQIACHDLEFYAVRPGYIYPVTPRQEPNLLYRFSRMLYPLLRPMVKQYSVRSDDLARAMWTLAKKGNNKEILENRDILEVIIDKE